MSLKDSIRSLIGRIPAWLLVALAGAGFWALSRGMTLGPGTAVGYAEEQVYSVAPLQAGRIKELRVTLGQAVKAGDILVQLDTRQLELRKQKVQAELEQAKAQLLAEQDLQAAQLARGQLQAVRANADVQRMRAELREVDQSVKRLSNLTTQRLVRADDVEAARKQQKALAAELSARPHGPVKDMEQMGLRPRPLSEQQKRLEQRLGPQHVAISVHEAELAQIEYEIGELTLRAPVDGQVGMILHRVGDVVSAGMPVVTLITSRPGHIVTYVPERQIRSYPLGTAVTLRKIGVAVAAMRAHVVELAPMIEEVPVRARPTPSVPLWGRRIVVKLDDPVSLLPGDAFRVSTR